MFTKTLHIAWHYLKTTYGNRTVLIFALLMPLLFTFVLGSVIGGPGRNGESPRWQIALVNADKGALGEALAARLAAHPALAVQTQTENEALAAVRAEEVTAAVLIPADFSAALLAGGESGVEYVAGSEVRSGQSVQAAVQAALTEVDGLIQAAEIATAAAAQLGLFEAPGQDQARYFQEALQRGLAREGTAPVQVQAAAVTRMQAADPIPDGFAQSSPGMLVTFALVGILNGAIVLILERQQGTLRRLLVLPLRKSAILGGKLLAIFAAGLLQAGVLILFGAFVFGVNWGQAPLALLLLLIAFVFAVTSLGMLIAGLARTYAQANALANILMYSVAALGGAWWPIEITPAWMQRLAQITPSYWAMQGFHDLLTRGLGLPAILGEAAALLGFGLLFLTLGVWRFRYE